MPRFKRDDVDRFFDYGIDLTNRIVYMGSASSSDDGESGVDSDMAERIIKALHVLDLAAPDGDKPITIIMNNPGGDWYHGLAIYDAIKACKNHVTIRAFGYVMSMGSIIMQAADERLMAPKATMMIHHGFDGFGADHPKKFKKWADESVRVREQMLDIYLEKIHAVNPAFPRKKLDKMCDFDTFLTAEEAVKLGLADGVIE